ncbi:hypothetical protein EYF80_035295 [Liparis tanakae]|uniref:Uncharacterized protein n=1 Tax=Liparis tanakae TaxID=230148 RepID=A0A4Z2GMR3_9TELE|nr:hypothetical protein EYF80_035295 [Liparis tanakae]
MQRLKGGEDGVLQSVWSRLVSSHGTLERLRGRRRRTPGSGVLVHRLTTVTTSRSFRTLALKHTVSKNKVIPPSQTFLRTSSSSSVRTLPASFSSGLVSGDSWRPSGLWPHGSRDFCPLTRMWEWPEDADSPGASPQSSCKKRLPRFIYADNMHRAYRRGLQRAHLPLPSSGVSTQTQQ